jgi:hypothetical protein
MDEILEKMCEMENIEQVLPPIEVISERAYLEFTVKKKVRRESGRCRYYCHGARSVASRMMRKRNLDGGRS